MFISLTNARVIYKKGIKMKHPKCFNFSLLISFPIFHHFNNSYCFFSSLKNLQMKESIFNVFDFDGSAKDNQRKYKHVHIRRDLHCYSSQNERMFCFVSCLWNTFLTAENKSGHMFVWRRLVKRNGLTI